MLLYSSTVNKLYKKLFDLRIQLWRINIIFTPSNLMSRIMVFEQMTYRLSKDEIKLSSVEYKTIAKECNLELVKHFLMRLRL